MLMEVWADLDSAGDTDADTTAALANRLAASDGWTRLASHRFSWASLAGTADTFAPIATLPAFQNGYGYTDNSPIAVGARRAMSADLVAWTRSAG